MKRFYHPLYGIFVLVLAFSILFFELKESKDLSDEKKYQEVLKNYTAEAITKVYPELTGVDKAAIREFVMTVDIDKGYVPVERKHELQSQLKNFRTLEERDLNWELMPSSISGRHRSFMMDPNNGDLWTGAVTGGLWKNTDFRNDAEWSPVPGLENLPISCLAYDPLNTNVFYMGTGESQTAILNYRESTSAGNGIWKSIDGGLTWDNLASTNGFRFVNDIVIRDESGTSVLYVAVASGVYWEGDFSSQPGDGLYRSDDGGQSWSQVLPNIPGETEPYAVSDIELASDNTLYVGTMRNLENKGGGIFLSSSNGTNWSIYDDYLDDPNNMGIAGRVVIESAASDPQVVYAIFNSGFENDLGQIRDYPPGIVLKRSADGGQTWSDLPQPDGGWSNIPWHAMAVGVDPNDPNKIVLGALNTYVMADASNPANTPLDWLNIALWFNHPTTLGGNFTPEEIEALLAEFVHADIHDIQFLGNSDEILITTDGGLHYAPDMTLTDGYDPEIGITEKPTFREVNKAMATTQYYTVALHPDPGVSLVLGGTQDNGTHELKTDLNDKFDRVSGGDGAYCFYDSNDDLKITSFQNNNYFFITSAGIQRFDTQVGTFINPVSYDDFNNILYSNPVVGPQGGLFPSINGRFLDSLFFIDANFFLGTPNLGIGQAGLIHLDADITEPFSAVQLSEDNSTLFLGTHLGKVYKVTGLPYDPVTERIDNGQLPVGYISSIAVGSNNNRLMVTYTNYGVESVWYTLSSGNQWTNIERNLPDMPIRWGLFNPYDDHKVVIATEMGIWGLENIEDPTEEWSSYGEGMPNVRVDMIKIRKADSVIAAATHGRGMYLGKLNQGARIEEPLGIREGQLASSFKVFPNPTSDYIEFQKQGQEHGSIHALSLYSVNGSLKKKLLLPNSGRVYIGDLENGVYVVKGYDRDRKEVFLTRLIKQ